MKFIYLLIFLFLLISCGTKDVTDKENENTKNLMVSPASQTGGGFGIPKPEKLGR